MNNKTNTYPAKPESTGAISYVSAAIEVSIIIPVYNNSGYTKNCLKLILNGKPYKHNFEIIVVDNASTDNTNELMHELCGKYDRVRYIRNEYNLGFGKACNVGAANANGSVLLFLNNDTEPQTGWMTSLVDRLNSDPKIGIVGSKLLYPDNTIQHCGIIIERSDIIRSGYWPVHMYRGMPADDERCNEAGEAEAVTGACLAIPKEIFVRAGGFDENYEMYFEDIDLCMTVNKLGYKVFYEPASVVIHYEGKSSPNLDIIEQKNFESANYFFKKWQDLFPGPEKEMLLKRGVLWASPVYNPSGYASEAIAFALGMFRLMNFRITHDNPYFSENFVANLPERWKQILNFVKLSQNGGTENLDSRTIFISHQPAHSFRKISALAYNIGRTMFETNSIPANWVDMCNRMDEIWVPGSFNYYTFINAGVDREKVFVIPEAIDTDFFNPDTVAPLNLKKKAGFNFLSVFEWSERKGAEILLRSYFDAFTSDDDVCLLLRTYAITKSDSTTVAEIQNRIDIIIDKYSYDKSKLPAYAILTEQLTSSDLAGLYKAADVFVLPSRGEGWGRPYMEAMAMGLPVIATNWSGNTSFMNHDNSFLINVNHLELVKNMELKFYEGQKWAVPDYEHLVYLMKFVFNNRIEAKKKGEKAREDIVTKFNLSTVANIAAKRLQEIEACLDKGIHPIQHRKQNELNIKWQGAFFVNHSLALVNREITTKLLKENINLSLLPSEENIFFPSEVREHIVLSKYMNKELEHTDFHITHQWPPDLNRPSSGKWIIIQPWEYGSLPEEWVKVFNEKADELWVPSNYVRQVYIESGVIESKVYVVPNGVDTELFHPVNRPYKLPTNKSFRFLFVGGTIFRKGIDILLDAYTSTFSAEDDVTLVIKDFGGNSVYKNQTFKEKIAEIGKNNQNPEIIHIDETLSEYEMASLYTACNILVHPYRGEGFGLPILEAMSSGIPAIVTNGGACLDFCNESNSILVDATKTYMPDNKIDQLITASRPWLFEPSLDDLKNKMKFAFANPAKIKELGLAARKSAEKFTWQHTSDIVMSRLNALRVDSNNETADSDINTLLLKVNELVNANRYAETAELLDEMIENYDDSVSPSIVSDLLSLKGSVYIASENFDAAKESFEYALKLNPSSSAACFGLGEIFHKNSEWTSAKVMFEWAVKNNPSNQKAKESLIQTNRILNIDPMHNSLIPDEIEND